MQNTKIVKEVDKDKWSEFINNHPNGNIFQTPEMYKVYENTKNYEPILIAVEDDNNEILGILLAVIQKEHAGLLGKLSSRAIIWGGPVIKNDDLEVLDFMLSEYNKLIKKKAIYSQFRNLWECNDAEKEVFEKNGYKFEEHLDIIHDLTKPIYEHLMQMHKGRRKNIRRAIRYGLELKKIDNKKELIESLELIKDTYKRVQLPMPDDSLFISAFEILQAQGFVKFFKASFEDRTIGVRFVFCYNNLIYDWFAGAHENFIDKYPNDFLPWKVMEWGHENGFNTFDFGGAGKPNIPYGVRDYKLKFGGELVNWGRFEKVHKSALMKIGKFGFKMYQWSNNGLRK